ncbi:TetR/AcrR family transcriptional regulator [Actinokineospora auranticolor]|uniref:TetR/AcrR family transcriptional repressor of lmrAB and yxaGH operons n=1 Tax=Actinokineospora auranticolor TaxID=155976 RepID=A0A2S6GZ52_9PSEU|nr:TetR/AcrR family transcriptional regulator [Actinokineospora auranticolor]PPK70488.1 TetR/AcrR family transcriptional repressor of lmrAB and yxaGH operons [Actinokineospora auranticolor]
MPRRTDTRDRTLRTAAELFRTHGYHGTGLNQVVAEGGLPKGSLYFHFPGGKEQLAAEAVGLAGAEVCAWVDRAFTETPDAVGALAAITGFLADELAASGFRRGCPIGTLAQDAGDAEPVRAACAEAFRAWHGVVRGHLARHGLPDPDALATTFLAAVEGAQLLSRNQRDTAPLRAVATALAPLLRKDS